jgi:hypothetical protein
MDEPSEDCSVRAIRKYRNSIKGKEKNAIRSQRFRCNTKTVCIYFKIEDQPLLDVIDFVADKNKESRSSLLRRIVLGSAARLSRGQG